MLNSVVVSGANGYLGSAICNHFSSKNWKVLKASRSGKDDIFFDLKHPEKVAQEKVNQKIDLFIHTAASNEIFCRDNPYESIFYNVAGTKCALEFCYLNQIPKFIYFSTFHVFGNPKGIINEMASPFPLNDYGLTHLQAETYIQMYCETNKLSATIIRPSNLFGLPKDLDSFKRWTLTPFAFCRDAIETGKIVLKTSGLQRRNFVSINDVVNFCELLYPQIEELPLVHLAGKSNFTIRSLAMIVQEVLKKNFDLEIELYFAQDQTTYHDFRFTSLYQEQVFAPNEKLEDFINDLCTTLLKQKNFKFVRS